MPCSAQFYLNFRRHPAHQFLEFIKSPFKKDSRNTVGAADGNSVVLGPSTRQSDLHRRNPHRQNRKKGKTGKLLTEFRFFCKMMMLFLGVAVEDSVVMAKLDPECRQNCLCLRSGNFISNAARQEELGKLNRNGVSSPTGKMEPSCDMQRWHNETKEKLKERWERWPDQGCKISRKKYI